MYIAHKKEISMSEMKFYLEEMMIMGLSSQLEDEVYYDLMNDGAYVEIHKLIHIAETMHKWYQVEF